MKLSVFYIKNWMILFVVAKTIVAADVVDLAVIFFHLPEEQFQCQTCATYYHPKC
jgi:hypothetical protein